MPIILWHLVYCLNMFQRNEEWVNDPITPILLWNRDALPIVSGPYIQMEMQQSTDYPHQVNQDIKG